MEIPEQSDGQYKTSDLGAALVRSVTGQSDIQFRGHRLHKGSQLLPMQAPHVAFGLQKNTDISIRAAMDSAALREKNSNFAMYSAHCPTKPVERLVYELLEQLRVETLVPRGMAGMQGNIDDQFAVWARAFHHSRLTETALGMLVFTVCQICWSRLTGKPVPPETEDLIEGTRAALVSVMGRDLAGLRHQRRNQAVYCGHALSIARLVGDMVNAAMPEIRPKSRDADEKTPHDEFVLLLDVDIPAGEASAAAAVGDDSPMQFSADRDYKVFSVEHDRVVQAASLVRGALLRELREGLDQRICARGINVSRLACLLLAALGSPQCDGWNDGQEMGHIDGRRLAQLIVSPTERHLFRLPRQKPATDCLVSLLVDCSGSMKVYADELTVMVDLLARAMDMAGVSAEILGFTTNAWHGGRPQKEWVATGRTAKPGRLNELCHIVFKDAETAWRRARRPIAALLKPDLFREGIHGEAVEWACGRIAARDASRRILIVITDGGPNDGATNLANDSLYLDRHLDAVLATHATGRDVEIFALGIGRNLSGIFSRGIQVDLSQTLTNQLFFRIAEMLMPRRR